MSVEGQIVDPTGGLKDLARDRLSMVRQDALSSDPIRLLRAVRLSRQFNLSIDQKTVEAIHRLAPMINTVAAERIQAEVTKLLKVPRSDLGLVALKRYQLLPHLFPHVADMTCSRWERTLTLLRALDWLKAAIRARRSRQIPNHREEIQAPSWLDEDLHRFLGELSSPWLGYLNEEVNQGLSRDHLLRWAALFAGIENNVVSERPASERKRGVAFTVSVAASRCRALRLPNHARDLVTTVVGNVLTPEDLASVTNNRRAIFRFFQRTNANGLAVAWFSVADSLASANLHPERTRCHRILGCLRTLSRAYFRFYDEVIAPDPLLGGDDLIQMGFEPGPCLGKALNSLIEAQASGEIRDRDQAIELISQRFAHPESVAGRGEQR
jgi:tRNA nucleotidyltransferase/poly(A) polymerase